MGVQDVLGTFVHGVYIIGAKAGDKVNGMTAAWVCQCSFSPKMVAVAIAPERFTYELIDKSEKFSVCLLREDQIDLARKFGATSGREEDKFEGVPYRLVDGVPVLEDCLSWVTCSLAGKIRSGDHYLLVGKVEKAEVVNPGPALIFRWEDYF